MTPIKTLLDDLAQGRGSARALVEQALERIADPAGEGARAVLKVHDAAARTQADEIDRRRAHGAAVGPLAGLPITVKDLFDLEGDVTSAGSRVLKDAAPAGRDAPAIARLRRAGAIVIGRTNMTEFAYSGLGLNPHYGTPRNPWDRATGRIPGGSSSGAAVSVSDGMAAAAIGTDTAGSVRIPAALCGLAGFKPTQRRVPLAGVFPLAASLDTVGPLAPTAACCALLDRIMAGQAPGLPPAPPVKGLRLGVPQTLVLDRLESAIADPFAEALSRLSRQGAEIVDLSFPEFAEIPKINQGGAIYRESYAVHRDRLNSRRDEYDPRVADRLERLKGIGAAQYRDVIAARRQLIERTVAITAPFDALLMPTTALAAPALDRLEKDDELYFATNILMLRNTLCANFLDRPALTIPMQRPGDAPAGLMAMGGRGADHRLLAVGMTLEAALAG